METTKLVTDSKIFRGSLLLLLILNAFLLYSFFRGADSDDPTLYFLDVGQGDSQLVELTGGVQILIDGGKGGAVLTELADALSPTDRYIDVVIVTHPDADHFGGIIDVIERYDVGAFISNGNNRDVEAYQYLLNLVEEKDIPHAIVQAGDRIVYQDFVFDVLWPTMRAAQGKKTNEGGIVMRFSTPSGSALFTADIGFDTEYVLRRDHSDVLSVDVLKVGHHGSKFSSGSSFLNLIQPSIAVVEVGKNSYGHPTADALARVAYVGAQIFRTDTDGTVKVVFTDGEAKVYHSGNGSHAD